MARQIRQIVNFLKQKLDELAGADAVVLRNAAKEELQYYLLDFIYHHPQYSQWIMYGGSALRICHGLNRMSVDLDFEITEKCTKPFLESIKKELEVYFAEKHSLESDILIIKISGTRGLLLKFMIGEEIGIDHHSKQVHVKIDLNHFVAPKTVTERIPINRDQLSFVVKTYNMSALMASKIAAVLLRGTRRVGKAVYQEKGRDIYDLLWYMEKKAVPDMDYLLAKSIDISDLRALFDQLTIQMNKVDDENLKQDLAPLFSDQNYISNWLASWRESYLRLKESYDIRTATKLREIRYGQNWPSEDYSFSFIYDTTEDQSATIVYTIGNFWFDFGRVDIPIKIDDSLIPIIHAADGRKINDQIKQYLTLFSQKNGEYLKKTNRVVLGDTIRTKTIRKTAGNLNRREEIVLDRSALLSCELEDLMK
ncbi:MAG: nucleotidyl transferase AbiEii/AbiGii toxin family protein [Parcubacteria group bacterium]|nr:nucleotidyl transferase AbiEii/AbiGii toxin family protein [Parcubacteria group bacterium]